MKNWKHFIKISCLFMFILGYQTVEAQQNLAQEAYLIFEQSCFDCHGPHGAFTEQLVIESASQLIDTGAELFGGHHLLNPNSIGDSVKKIPQNGCPRVNRDFQTQQLEPSSGRWIHGFEY